MDCQTPKRQGKQTSIKTSHNNLIIMRCFTVVWVNVKLSKFENIPNMFIFHHVLYLLNLHTNKQSKYINKPTLEAVFNNHPTCFVLHITIIRGITMTANTKLLNFLSIFCTTLQVKSKQWYTIWPQNTHIYLVCNLLLLHTGNYLQTCIKFAI